MDISSSIPDRLFDILDQESGIVRMRATQGTSETLRHLLGILNEPVQKYVDSRLISFSSPHDLIYPNSIEQVEDLVPARTLVLQRLEAYSHRFATLVSSISHNTHRVTSATAYISAPDSQAFGWHTDEWDNIVWQIKGVKQFEFKNCEHEILTAGDVLYIPSGVVHRTKTIEQSIHVSLVILSKERTKTLVRLCDELSSATQ